jgi:hypothetical protein
VTMTLKVYRVNADGERETIREEAVIPAAALPMRSPAFPLCQCPRRACQERLLTPAQRLAGAS